MEHRYLNGPSSVVKIRLILQELCYQLINLALLTRLPMAAASGVKSCLFRVGPKRTVTGEGAAVGLNGGFLHTARPGANCLSRPEIPEDVSYEKAPRVPQGRKAEKVSGNRYGGNVGAQEGAIHRKR